MSQGNNRTTGKALRNLRWTLFAVGLVISLLMVVRSQVGGDQLNLLARGWLLAKQGHWVPYGNPDSSGGKAPGGMTSLVVGLPLMWWSDFLAPTFLVLAFHVLAYLMLDRLLREVVSEPERVLFVVFYWLNPWRLYHSAFLWNPNYLFLFGALHAYTVFHQRRAPSFWCSFTHVVGIGLACQLHFSAVLLIAASAFLYFAGYFKPNWKGVGVAVLAILASLIPWLHEVTTNPAILPLKKGFLGRGLIFVFPLARGLLYWLRYASLSFGRDMVSFNFTPALGPTANAILTPILFAVTALASISVVLPVVANRWLWLRAGRTWRQWDSDVADARAWLEGYVLWTFIAAAGVFALAPTTVMSWQGFPVLHAAVLPMVLWLGASSQKAPSPAFKKVLKVYLPLCLFLLISMALGSPQYRRGGLHTPLVSDHEMLHALKILDRCDVSPNQPSGFWPDVLVDSRPSPSSSAGQ